MKNLSLIVAIDQRNAIGRNGDQLIYISEDLRHFKALTQGKTVVMGRKTSDALPKGVLPNRRNIILTRNKNYTKQGAECFNSKDEILENVKNDDVFIIGGGEIYEMFINDADTLYVTHIHKTFENTDTFFPKIDDTIWQVAEKSDIKTDKDVNFQFVSYTRKSELLPR